MGGNQFYRARCRLLASPCSSLSLFDDSARSEPNYWLRPSTAKAGSCRDTVHAAKRGQMTVRSRALLSPIIVDVTASRSRFVRCGQRWVVERAVLTANGYVFLTPQPSSEDRMRRRWREMNRGFAGEAAITRVTSRPPGNHAGRAGAAGSRGRLRGNVDTPAALSALTSGGPTYLFPAQTTSSSTAYSLQACFANWAQWLSARLMASKPPALKDQDPLGEIANARGSPAARKR